MMVCTKCDENLMAVAMHIGLEACGARSSWDARKCEVDGGKHEWKTVPEKLVEEKTVEK